MSTVNLWQNYTRIWIESYNEFMKRYMTLTENWLQFTITSASMCDIVNFALVV